MLVGCKSYCHSELALCTEINFVTKRIAQMFTKRTRNNEYSFFLTLLENKLTGCNRHLVNLLLFQVLKIYLTLLRTRFSPLCVFLQTGDDWQKLILKQVLTVAVIWVADEREKGEADGTLEGLEHCILSKGIYCHLGRVAA